MRTPFPLLCLLILLCGWSHGAGDVSRYLPTPGLRPLITGTTTAPARPADLVLTAPEGFSVPADGPELVRSFVVPVEKLSQAVYVEALQLTPAPGNGSPTTHAMIRLDASLESRKADTADPGPGFANHPHYSGVRRPTSLVAAWTPWAPVVTAAPGVWRLFPDCDLVVTCTIMPDGKNTEVRPQISLWFAAQAPTTHVVTLRMANEAITIQPGSDDTSARDTFNLPVDAKLLAVYPDANHWTKTIRLDLTGPRTEKGEPISERLFDIADWESGLQEWYRFEEPVELSRGSKLDLQIRYANAEGNRLVRWGPRPEDERGEIYLTLATETDAELYELLKMASVHQLALAIEGAEANGQDDLASHVRLAKLYCDLGQPETAVAHGLKAVSLNADSAEAHAALGSAYVTQNRDFAAQEHLERAVLLNPDLADAYYNLGNVFLRYGVIEKAYSAYEKAVQLDPRDARYANNLGHLMMQKDQNDKAEVIFARIVGRNPFHAPSTANLARIKEMKGDKAAALALYRRAVTLAPAMSPTLQPLIARAEKELQKK